jgi:FtsP/CotA-like multicopper oxidase with cupredoxin domain
MYRLTVVNNLDKWAPLPGAKAPMGGGGMDMGGGVKNTYHNPTVTNLHLHGLHISGQAPGDDTFGAIGPGESYTYM